MLFQPRFTGRRPTDSTWSFVRCCLYPVELPLFCLSRTRNPTPIPPRPHIYDCLLATNGHTRGRSSWRVDLFWFHVVRTEACRSLLCRVHRYLLKSAITVCLMGHTAVQTSVAQSFCQFGGVLENRRACVLHVAFVAKQFDKRDKVTVDTWRISLSLSPEGVDGSVLSCVPACSPVAVRRFKTTFTDTAGDIPAVSLLPPPKRDPRGQRPGPRSPHCYFRGRRCTAAPNVSERPTTHVPQPLLPGGVRRYVPAWHSTEGDVALLTEQARGGVRQV